ncbi:MAG: hypothetical protein ACLU2X_05035 [Ruminococcus sp.]
MKFTLYAADCTGNAKNTIYPHQKVITSEADLKKAVASDHVCAKYDNDTRCDANFQISDVVPMNCDNDHSNNPDDWITPEKLSEMLSFRPPSLPCIFPDHALQGCCIPQEHQSPHLQGTAVLRRQCTGRFPFPVRLEG